jgi:uncharacterized LabA/DUF88 family protein
VATEPTTKRVFAYFDGQNLFRAALEAFEYFHPNYDPFLLAAKVCALDPSWRLHDVRFYTGVPAAKEDPFWHEFWSRKLAQLGKRGAKVYSRALRYQEQEYKFAGGGSITTTVPKEKGIDIRIALDLIRACTDNLCDIALLFSQDQDFSEVVDEVAALSAKSGRWMKVYTAFPDSDKRKAGCRRGVDRTTWIRIDRVLYDACIDTRDYRPPKRRPPTKSGGTLKGGL